MESLLRRHRRMIAAAVAIGLGAAMVGVTPARAAEGDPVVGSDVKYTTDADFAKGLIANLNNDVSGTLRVNSSGGSFPFIWVALSDRETIAKIDVNTGTILGEYRGMSEGAGVHATSRTTVMIDGSVWVGHRFISTVTHIGLKEAGQCVDRNGNSVIDTSSGYGNVLGWPGGSSGVSAPVSVAVDECILHHVDTPGGDSRHLSADKNNDIWVGSFSGSRGFSRIDGTSGAFELGSAGAVGQSTSCGGYGGLIDGNGVIWSANGGSSGLLRWDPNLPGSETNPRCIGIPVYGLAIDPGGFIWANEFGTQVRKVSPDGNTILGPFPNGVPSISQGLAVDPNGDVWVSSGLFCSGGSCPIGHLKNDGTLVGSVPNPTGDGSTGISVDSNGKVWSANLQASTATRIDPTAGPLGLDGVTPLGAVDLTVSFPATSAGPGTVALPKASPYNYSDMTGSIALGSTAKQGTWTIIQDAGQAGFDWATVIINTEKQGFIPPGASIAAKIEARAAESPAGLGAQDYSTFLNCGSVAVKGRFIQVRLTLSTSPEGQSPVLSDVRIRGGKPPTSQECAGVTRRPGYALLSRDGGWFAYGEITFLGSAGLRSAAVTGPSGKSYVGNFVGGAITPTQNGYWAVGSDGGTFAFGDATFLGGMAGKKLNAPIVGMAATPSGLGYWLVASDGGIFAFGDAVFRGSAGGLKLNKPIVGMAATPTGLGYWLVASDGGVFAYGDAAFGGSLAAARLNQPVVGMAANPVAGYWLVGADGGVFPFGGAGFFQSMGGKTLRAPITGISSSASGNGYTLAALDGGTFAFGDAPFFGSASPLALRAPIVAIVSI